MILLTGGTGFVGKEIFVQLRAQGRRVRVLTRKNDSLSKEEGVEFFSGDVTRPETLCGCCEGVDAVIHLVGIIAEAGEATFERVHVRGTENILAEAKKSGVKRFLHMSAMNTRPHAAARYHQTKWEAEELVRQSGLNWTIFRPSIIFGAEDKFTNLFAAMWRLSVLGILPCIGDGKNILRPVAVEKVAGSFIQAIADEQTLAQTLELGGAPVAFGDMLKEIGRSVGFKRPLLIPIPFPAAYALAAALEKIPPRPILTRDQVIMLQEDQIGIAE